MSFRDAEKPHWPEDAGQRKIRVVAHIVQVGRQRVLAHQNRQQVVSAKASRVRNIQLKGRKAAFVRSNALAVEPDLSPAINAVEKQLQSPSPQAPRNLQMPAVSARSGRTGE